MKNLSALEHAFAIAVLGPCLFVAGCSGTDDAESAGDDTSASASAIVTSSVIKHVFVIPMENKSSTAIYGNTAYRAT